MSRVGWPLSQLVARLLMLLGPLVGLVAAAAAEVPPPGWVTALVVVLAVGWVFMPESVLGTLCLAMVLAWWGVADISGLPAEALVAALGLLVAHVAAVVTAYGPPEMAVDTPTVRLWADPRRGGLRRRADRLDARGAGARPAGAPGRVDRGDGGRRRRGGPRDGGVRAAHRSASVTAEQEEYVERVLEYVERVPRGRVTTYGAIADAVGGGPRQVGSVMSRHGGPVPWWRVVRADGSLPPSHEVEARQCYLEEGTPLRPSGSVDIVRAFWSPEDDEATG